MYKEKENWSADKEKLNAQIKGILIFKWLKSIYINFYLDIYISLIFILWQISDIYAKLLILFNVLCFIVIIKFLFHKNVFYLINYIFKNILVYIKYN